MYLTPSTELVDFETMEPTHYLYILFDIFFNAIPTTNLIVDISKE